MSWARGLAAAGWLVALSIATVSRAEIQRLASDGTVYRVEVQTFAQSGRPTGTVLRATRQRPKGGKETANIPGTDDPIVERDPALEIDPSSGRPLVVWARNDGPGFNLYASRYDGSWSTPRLIARLDGDDVEPQIRFDARYLHVSWRQDYLGQTTYWRSSFLATTLEPAFGPERIPTDDAMPPFVDGETASVADAPASDQFFCATIASRVPGDPLRACIWGVRDEPVPINYRQLLPLPATVHAVSYSEARYLAGRFTYWAVTPDNKLHYTTLFNGQWAEMRVIELSPQTSAADARLLLIDLNHRLLNGGH
jgi:hypothetical protein